MKPIMKELTIKTTLELYTGAAVSVIITLTKSKSWWDPQWSHYLHCWAIRSDRKKSNVSWQQLLLHAVKGSGPTLLGWIWLHHIKLNWQSLKMASLSGKTVDSEKHTDTQNVFVEELGQTKSLKQHHLELSPSLVKHVLFKSSNKRRAWSFRITRNFAKGLIQHLLFLFPYLKATWSDCVVMIIQSH